MAGYPVPKPSNSCVCHTLYECMPARIYPAVTRNVLIDSQLNQWNVSIYLVSFFANKLRGENDVGINPFTICRAAVGELLSPCDVSDGTSGDRSVLLRGL